MSAAGAAGAPGGTGAAGAPGATAVLALGSNLGDRFAYLQGAVTSLDQDRGVVAVSSVYETDPVGGPAQDDYLNAVVLIPAASPRELLGLARWCEAQASRERTVRWGPRTLDVDVVACGDVRSDDPEILMPHPRAHERAFVCVPWLDVEPDAVLPGYGRVADIVAAMRREGVADGVRRTSLELPVPGTRVLRTPMTRLGGGGGTGATDATA